MDSSKYKVIIHWHETGEEDEELFESYDELTNFFYIIRNKGKHYKCSYDIIRIREELYNVIYQNELLNHNFDINELIDDVGRVKRDSK